MEASSGTDNVSEAYEEDVAPQACTMKTECSDNATKTDQAEERPLEARGMVIHDNTSKLGLNVKENDGNDTTHREVDLDTFSKFNPNQCCRQRSSPTGSSLAQPGTSAAAFYETPIQPIVSSNATAGTPVSPTLQSTYNAMDIMALPQVNGTSTDAIASALFQSPVPNDGLTEQQSDFPETTEEVHGTSQMPRNDGATVTSAHTSTNDTLANDTVPTPTSHNDVVTIMDPSIASSLHTISESIETFKRSCRSLFSDNDDVGETAQERNMPLRISPENDSNSLIETFPNGLNTLSETMAELKDDCRRLLSDDGSGSTDAVNQGDSVFNQAGESGMTTMTIPSQETEHAADNSIRGHFFARTSPEVEDPGPPTPEEGRQCEAITASNSTEITSSTPAMDRDLFATEENRVSGVGTVSNSTDAGVGIAGNSDLVAIEGNRQSDNLAEQNSIATNSVEAPTSANEGSGVQDDGEENSQSRTVLISNSFEVGSGMAPISADVDRDLVATEEDGGHCAETELSGSSSTSDAQHGAHANPDKNSQNQLILSAERRQTLLQQLSMTDTMKDYLFNDKELMNIQRLLADAITCKVSLPDIECILAGGAEVNASVSKGLKPLHYAAYINDASYVTFLLDRGAHVNAQDDVGYTPLHLCARHGHYETMQVLIDHGAIVNFCDGGLDIPEGLQTIGYLTLEPLNLAIENNNVDCVRLLLENGANPENQYILGSEINLVPLEYTRCLELLLMYGANPNVYNRSGITPLMKSCKERQTDALKLLIEYGADVNMQCPPRFEQKTALHIAILIGCMETVQILVEAGASLKKPENFRGGALNTAVVHGRPEICRYLIKQGADVNELNDEDCPPLLVACGASRLRNRTEIIQILLENGANPHFYNTRISYAVPGLTPLVEYLANADNPEYEVVHLLVKYGARVHFKIASKMLQLLDPYGVLKHLVSVQIKRNILNLLIEAGECYDTEKILRDRSIPESQRSSLLAASTTPSSLRHQARLSIRKYLRGLPITVPIEQLPLPFLLKSYLLFDFD